MSVKIDIVTPIVWTTVVEAEGKHAAKLPSVGYGSSKCRDSVMSLVHAL